MFFQIIFLLICKTYSIIDIKYGLFLFAGMCKYYSELIGETDLGI